MKIRIKFSKHGALKFIGHLDMMRYFQKAIRRSGIDIAYSEGFSPHQIMSFAAPLGVGLESDGEYFDIEVHSTLSTTEAVAKLNEEMVSGIEILEYKLLPEHAKSAMSIVAAASYDIYYKEKCENPFTFQQLEEAVFQHIISREEILIMKKTKKNERQINLRPNIYDCSVVETMTGPSFRILAAAGSVENIKPELVLEYLYARMRLPYPKYSLQTVRKEVYAGSSEEGFLPLGSLGDDIES